MSDDDGLFAALARLDLDASQARLTLAVGGTHEDAAAIMRGDAMNNGAATVVAGGAVIPTSDSCGRFEHVIE